jgi:hypothetical protein
MTLRELKSLKKTFEKKRIHYALMTSWSRPRGEGYNEGLLDCIKVLDRKIKKLEKEKQ